MPCRVERDVETRTPRAFAAPVVCGAPQAATSAGSCLSNAAIASALAARAPPGGLVIVPTARGTGTRGEAAGRGTTIGCWRELRGGAATELSVASLTLEKERPHYARAARSRSRWRRERTPRGARRWRAPTDELATMPPLRGRASSPRPSTAPGSRFRASCSRPVRWTRSSGPRRDRSRTRRWP